MVPFLGCSGRPAHRPGPREPKGHTVQVVKGNGRLAVPTGSFRVARRHLAAAGRLAFQSHPHHGAWGELTYMISSILTHLLWTVIVFRSFYSPFKKNEITTSPCGCQNEGKEKWGVSTAGMQTARRPGVCGPHIQGPTAGSPRLFCYPLHQTLRSSWPCRQLHNVDDIGSVCLLTLRRGKGGEREPNLSP